MRRTSAIHKDVDKFGAGKHGFKNGNKALGIIATELEAEWHDSIQEEISNVIEATGAALNPADNTQLFNAIEALVAQTGAILGAYRNLKVDALGVSNYTCTITADEVVLENSTNKYLTVRGINKTVNANGVVGAPLSIMSARAASTWYYCWLWYNVANGLTATLDTSSTVPTAPAGYLTTDYKMRLPGACRTDSSGSTYLLQISTRGKNSYYVVLSASNVAGLPILISGTQGNTSTPTWVAAAIGAFVPPTAVAIGLTLAEVNTSAGAMAAPNNSYGSYGSLTNPPPLSASVPSGNSTISAFFMIESSNVYYAAAGASNALFCNGWIDNI